MAKVAFDLLKRTGKTITAAESLTAGLSKRLWQIFQGRLASLQVVLSPIVWKKKARCCLFQLKSWSNMEWCLILQLKPWLHRPVKLTGSDYGVSLTGVAGPDSLEGHPAGTVFIGLATPNGVDSVKLISLDVAGRMSAKLQFFMPLIWCAWLY